MAENITQCFLCPATVCGQARRITPWPALTQWLYSAASQLHEQLGTCKLHVQVQQPLVRLQHSTCRVDANRLRQAILDSGQCLLLPVLQQLAPLLLQAVYPTPGSCKLPSQSCSNHFLTLNSCVCPVMSMSAPICRCSMARASLSPQGTTWCP
jgi:hypothetical protein